MANFFSIRPYVSYDTKCESYDVAYMANDSKVYHRITPLLYISKKERKQLNLLPALTNSMRQPSFLTVTPSTRMIKNQLYNGGFPQMTFYHFEDILSIYKTCYI